MYTSIHIHTIKSYVIFTHTHTYLQRAGLLDVSRSQNLFCSHRLNTTEVDFLYLEVCPDDIYKIQMCYFMDKNLIMIVDAMFKNGTG